MIARPSPVASAQSPPLARASRAHHTSLPCRATCALRCIRVSKRSFRQQARTPSRSLASRFAAPTTRSCSSPRSSARAASWRARPETTRRAWRSLVKRSKSAASSACRWPRDARRVLLSNRAREFACLLLYGRTDRPRIKVDAVRMHGARSAPTPWSGDDWCSSQYL